MTGILQSQIAVVTGGGQGLGQAICRALAAEGAYVVVIPLNRESATTTVAAEVATEHDRQTLGLKVDEFYTTRGSASCTFTARLRSIDSYEAKSITSPCFGKGFYFYAHLYSAA